MPPQKPRQMSFGKPAPQVKSGEILDVDEAAALLKVSRKTIYNRVKAGTLPSARLGKKILFSRQRLIKWVADGGDNAATEENEQLSLEQLLNNGQARIISKR